MVKEADKRKPGTAEVTRETCAGAPQGTAADVSRETLETVAPNKAAAARGGMAREPEHGETEHGETDKAPAHRAVVLPTPRPRAKTSNLWRVLAELACWIPGLLALTAWARSGGFLDLTNTTGSAVQALGALAGMCAAYALLLQLLLMARVPFIERGFGRDKIIAIHKTLGFCVFWVILAHIFLVSLGYGMSLRAYGFNHNPLIQFGHLIADFQGLDLALLGTAILVGAVIILSLKRLRKVLRYELWHVWHLASYIAILLVLPHMVWSGGSFITSRLARFVWGTIWLATFVSLIYFRMLRPWLRSRHHQLHVVEALPDGARGVEVRMAGRNLDRFAARGGQFYIWRFMDGENGWWQGHPFSLSMPPDAQNYQICVRVVGDHTERIKKLKPGTRVIAEGPFGRINGDLRQGNTLLMFAAGAGLGPMLAILAEQEWAPGEAILVTRDNSPDESMMVAEINALVSQRGLKWVSLVGHHGKGGSSWYPADQDGNGTDGAVVIRGWLDELENTGSYQDHGGTDVFMCGPPPWMDAVKQDLAKAGVSPQQIHIEEFAF